MEDYEFKIIKKYPELFGKIPFDESETAMSDGFRVNDGWIPLLEEAFEKLSIVVKEKELKDFKILQVKEKFGDLRIYTTMSYNEDISSIISETVDKSIKTCSICSSELDKDTRSSYLMGSVCKNCFNKMEIKK